MVMKTISLQYNNIITVFFVDIYIRAVKAHLAERVHARVIVDLDGDLDLVTGAILDLGIEIATREKTLNLVTHEVEDLADIDFKTVLT